MLVCVASAFPIATGKHIGDCGPCAFDLSFMHASAGSWRCKEHGKHKESGWEYTLSVPCVLFVHKKRHSNTTQLEHPLSLPRSRSTNTQNERRRARHRSKVPSRCKRGESPPNGVARRPHDHCQRGRTRRARSDSVRAPPSSLERASTSRPKPGRGRSCSIQQPPLVQYGHHGC